MSLLGTEETNDINYIELSHKLTLEANLILNDIDQQMLLAECEFGRTLSPRMNDVKMQINRVSTTMGTCENDEKSKKMLRFQLNDLESSLRNLEMEIKILYPNASGECPAALNRILQHMVRLRGCVTTSVGGMW